MTSALLMLLAVAGTVFFFVRGFQLRSGYRRLSQLEAKRAELEEARARDERLPLRARLHQRMVASGYDGDAFPFAAGLAFLYVGVITALHLFGLSNVTASLVALPGSLLVVASVVKWAASSRRRKFNEQFIELLDLISGKIDTGVGVQTALNNIVPTMQDPLREEMSGVLDAQLATKDLVGAMRELSTRYPSRAFELFVASLEIDQAGGHAIGPALKQCAELLRRDFRLVAEANAEVSQQRGEFFLVLAILGAVAASMLFGHDPGRHEAYTSPIGLIILTVTGANVAVGIWRLMRLLRNLRGDVK